MPIFANSSSLLLPTQSRMLRRPSCSACSQSQADLSTRDMDSGCSLTWHVTSLASGSSRVQSYSQVSTLTLQCPAGVGKDGVTMVSKELCYIAEGVNRLLLSINLGIIGKDFPSIGSSVDNVSVNSCAHADEGDQCSCPKRSPTPPAPSQLPYPATEENIPKLKEWILDYYVGSKG